MEELYFFHSENCDSIYILFLIPWLYFINFLLYCFDPYFMKIIFLKNAVFSSRNGYLLFSIGEKLILDFYKRTAFMVKQ